MHISCFNVEIIDLQNFVNNQSRVSYFKVLYILRGRIENLVWKILKTWYFQVRIKCTAWKKKVISFNARSLDVTINSRKLYGQMQSYLLEKLESLSLTLLANVNSTLYRKPRHAPQYNDVSYLYTLRLRLRRSLYSEEEERSTSGSGVLNRLVTALLRRRGCEHPRIFIVRVPRLPNYYFLLLRTNIAFYFLADCYINSSYWTNFFVFHFN